MSKLLLSGIVSSDDDLELYGWFGWTAFCPAMLRNAIAETDPSDTLEIELNSPGGNAMAGIEMHSILLDAACKTQVVVQSYAASAASVLALGADAVLATPGAQFMLHLPSVSTQGNETAHKQSLQMLQSTADAMLNIYCGRCKEKTTRDELRAIMENETWLSAQRCIETGLIDGVYDPKGDLRLDIAAAFGLPDIGVLRSRFEAAKAAEGSGAAPIITTQDWKAQAAINIEKNRF